MTLFWRKKKFVVNEPDPVYHVVYLGNVVTAIAKGDGCYEKALALIWKTYCTRSRPDIPMKLVVTRSGLKAHTKAQGLTEYWAHRITYCMAPLDYPRVFVWIYKHEGKRMKPELRCHAALCKKPDMPPAMAVQLSEKVSMALSEYKRDKLNCQNKRLNGTSLPLRKLLLRTGDKNFRPPMARSKSAPKLYSIEECSEEEEEGTGETNDEDEEYDDDGDDTFSVYEGSDVNGNRLLSVGSGVNYECDFYREAGADPQDDDDHDSTLTVVPADPVVSNSPSPKPTISSAFYFPRPDQIKVPPSKDINENHTLPETPFLHSPSSALTAPPKRPHAPSSPVPPARRSAAGRSPTTLPSAIIFEPASVGLVKNSAISSKPTVNGVSKSYSYASVPTATGALTGCRYIKNKDSRFSSFASINLSTENGPEFHNSSTKSINFSNEKKDVFLSLDNAPLMLPTDLPPIADSVSSTQMPANIDISPNDQICNRDSFVFSADSKNSSANSPTELSSRSTSSSAGMDFYYSPASNLKSSHPQHVTQRSIDSSCSAKSSQSSNYTSDSNSDITINASSSTNSSGIASDPLVPRGVPKRETALENHSEFKLSQPIEYPQTPLHGAFPPSKARRQPSPSPLVPEHQRSPRSDADLMDADAVSEESGYHDEKSSVESGSEDTLPDDSDGENLPKRMDASLDGTTRRGHVISITCL